MDKIETNWLPHLSAEIVSDAHGNLLDAYAVALEGWRRGLTLKWHVKDSEKFKEMKTWYVEKPGKLFSLSSHDRTHYFFRTRGSKVTNEAVEIGMDKYRTKQALAEKNVSVPKGKKFSETDSTETIVEYGQSIGFPVVLKPTDDSFGRGVISNITSAGELEYSLHYLTEDLGYKNIIIEQHIPGDDYRLYVVDKEVVGAIKRIPPNVIGDGVQTIKTLIELKNDERNENPRLVSCLIEINQNLLEFIGRKGYTLDSIPGDGEQVFLSELSNISLGGDPIDVLDELDDSMKQIAIDAVQAIPNLHHAAVDLMIHSDNNNGYVIELNPTSQLGGILFPIKGKSRDVPKAIIDYYFPETKEDNENNNKGKVYFDYHDVLDPLKSGQVKSVTVTPAPIDPLYIKKFTVIGDVQDIGYHRGLRKQAFERFLHGYIINLENGDIDIVVAGTDPEMVDDFKYAIFEDERSHVMEVIDVEHDEPIKVGFEIKADLKTQLEELNQIKQEMEVTELEIKKAQVQNRKLHSSLSWKATKPVRALGAVIKKMK